MKKILLMLTLTLLGCQHAPNENRLIGTWRMDPQRTLAELSKENSKALIKIRKIVEWNANKKCGSLRLVYEKNTYRTILEPISDSSAPYKIIENGSDYVIIDQFENGGTTKINFVENGFYVNQEIDGVAFKDYFTNTPCL